MKKKLIAYCLVAAGLFFAHQVMGASNEMVATSPMFRASLDNALTRMNGEARASTRSYGIKQGAAKASACRVALLETSQQESCYWCTYAGGPTACDYTSCPESCQPTYSSTCTGETCQFTGCESATCFHTCSPNFTCTGPPDCN